MANRLSECSGRAPAQMAARSGTPGNVRSQDVDETEYLMSSPTNAQRLREAIDQLKSIGGTPKDPAMATR